MKNARRSTAICKSEICSPSSNPRPGPLFGEARRTGSIREPGPGPPGLATSAGPLRVLSPPGFRLSSAVSRRSHHCAPARAPTVIENLALACLHSNRHKGPNIAGRDPATGELVRLFHPRQEQWSRHFEWRAAELSGGTAIGRITIQVLAINDPDFLAVREALMEEGVFPAE